MESRKKKVEIRMRNISEKKILTKFEAITFDARLDPITAYESYIEVFKDIEKLKEEFPMAQRKNQNQNQIMIKNLRDI